MAFIAEQINALAHDAAGAMKAVRRALQDAGVIEDLGPDVGGPIETALRNFGSNPTPVERAVAPAFRGEPAETAATTRARRSRRRRSFEPEVTDADVADILSRHF